MKSMRIIRFRSRLVVEGRFINQQSSRDSYGHVFLTIDPVSTRALSFAWEVSPTDIPIDYSEAVAAGVNAVLDKAELSCIETSIRVTGGSFNSIDSSPMCYQIAAARAFEEAINSAGVISDA